ncbi:MAG: hypothetical protein HQL94_08440, partial [Magnetococcales bacterium]|nr:hypothetical protein [Magnetococcales bacterium]
MILNLIVASILFTPLTEMLAQPLIVDEPVRPSPVAVVFSAGWVTPNIMDYRTLIRLQKGLELYKTGLAKKIICLGGIALPDQKGNPFTIAQGMKNMLL